MHYSVFLGSSLSASTLKQLRYSFTGLTPDTAYSVQVRAFGSGNDSLVSKFSFTTEDTYFTFAKMILPDDISYDLALTPEQWFFNDYFQRKI